MNLRPILTTILDQYTLHVEGIHGLAHWARVFENGQRICEETDADFKVVSLFSILHDSCRHNDGYDPDHGPRAAEFTAKLGPEILEIDERQLRLLMRACEGHTLEQFHDDITIQACWDADRLDLGRIGVLPDPARLNTDFAKRQDTIDWAYQRGSREIVPVFVKQDWDIELYSP